MGCATWATMRPPCFGPQPQPALRRVLCEGRTLRQTGRGVPTVKALVGLGKKYGVDLPICRTVYEIVYQKAGPMEAPAEAVCSVGKGREFDQ